MDRATTVTKYFLPFKTLKALCQSDELIRLQAFSYYSSTVKFLMSSSMLQWAASDNFA